MSFAIGRIGTLRNPVRRLSSERRSPRRQTSRTCRGHEGLDNATATDVYYGSGRGVWEEGPYAAGLGRRFRKHQTERAAPRER